MRTSSSPIVLESGELVVTGALPTESVSTLPPVGDNEYELLLADKCRVLIGQYLKLFSVWTSREREVDDLVYVHCFHLKHQVVHRSTENLRLAKLKLVGKFK